MFWLGAVVDRGMSAFLLLSSIGYAVIAGFIAILVGHRVAWSRGLDPIGWGWAPVTILTGLASSRMLMLYWAAADSSIEPDLLMRIRATALGSGISTLSGASLATSLILLAFACTMWIPALVRPGPQREASPAVASGALAGWAIGVLLAAAGVFGLVGTQGLLELGPALFILPVLSLAPAAAVMLASLQQSAEHEHRARLAAMRLSIGTAGFLGVGFMGEMFRYAAYVLMFQTVSGVGVDRKSHMVELGVEVTNLAAYLGWSLALVPLLTGWGSAISSLPLFGPRQWRSVASDGAHALLMLGAAATGLWVYLRLVGLFLG